MNIISNTIKIKKFLLLFLILVVFSTFVIAALPIANCDNDDNCDDNKFCNSEGSCQSCNCYYPTECAESQTTRPNFFGEYNNKCRNDYCPSITRNSDGLPCEEFGVCQDGECTVPSNRIVCGEGTSTFTINSDSLYSIDFDCTLYTQTIYVDEKAVFYAKNFIIPDNEIINIVQKDPPFHTLIEDYLKGGRGGENTKDPTQGKGGRGGYSGGGATLTSPAGISFSAVSGGYPLGTSGGDPGERGITGGHVTLVATQKIILNGIINASGGEGTEGGYNKNYGGGGGGAGGSGGAIILHSNSLEGNGKLIVSGGKGGDGGGGITTGGGGAGGSGGIIMINASEISPFLQYFGSSSFSIEGGFEGKRGYTNSETKNLGEQGASGNYGQLIIVRNECNDCSTNGVCYCPSGCFESEGKLISMSETCGGFVSKANSCSQMASLENPLKCPSGCIIPEGTIIFQKTCGVGSFNIKFEYEYDILGNLINVKFPKSENMNILASFDSFGNLISKTDPDSGTTTYTRSISGKLTSKTDARGQTLEYLYDAMGRIKSVIIK